MSIDLGLIFKLEALYENNQIQKKTGVKQNDPD